MSHFVGKKKKSLLFSSLKKKKPFELECDAFGVGIDVVLLQGDRHIV